MKNLEEIKDLPQKMGNRAYSVTRFAENTFIVYDSNGDVLMEENSRMPIIFEDFHIKTIYGIVSRVLGDYFIDEKPCTEDEAYACLTAMSNIPNSGKCVSQPGEYN